MTYAGSAGTNEVKRTMDKPENMSPDEAAPPRVAFNESRRRLFKRLALIAATGYLAPKAIMISEPWACNKANMPAPHGMSSSGPFC